jgi:hypothetical protein
MVTDLRPAQLAAEFPNGISPAGIDGLLFGFDVAALGVGVSVFFEFDSVFLSR